MHKLMKPRTLLRGAIPLVAPVIVAIFTLVLPRSASAQADEASAAYCWDSIAHLVPTYIQARSWRDVRRRFHSLVCEERQSDTRAALDLSLPLPGLGRMGLGLGGSNETRHRACEQRDQYLDHHALSSFLMQVGNKDVVPAMRVCAQLDRESNEAFAVAETLAGESTVVVTVRRIVAGEQEITRFAPYAQGTNCTYSAPLPFTLRNGEEWTARCPRDPERHFGATVTTSIGAAQSIVAPTRTFTLRTVLPAEPSRQAGWSAESCVRTCNAHNRAPCETEAVLENREPNVHLGHPIESRCSPAHQGRCRYYASRIAPPVVSINGQHVTERWRFRSRRANVCIRAMRYLPGAPARTETQQVRIGPTWSNLEVRGQQVLIDPNDGVEYSLDDPIFERNGSQIRFRSSIRTDSAATGPTR